MKRDLAERLLLISVVTVAISFLSVNVFLLVGIRIAYVWFVMLGIGFTSYILAPILPVRPSPEKDKPRCQYLKGPKIISSLVRGSIFRWHLSLQKRLNQLSVMNPAHNTKEHPDKADCHSPIHKRIISKAKKGSNHDWEEPTITTYWQTHNRGVCFICLCAYTIVSAGRKEHLHPVYRSNDMEISTLIADLISTPSKLLVTRQKQRCVTGFLFSGSIERFCFL